jgi:hypothetical protein
MLRKFVVLTQSEDGLHIEQMDEVTLVKRLEEAYYGDLEPLDHLPKFEDGQFRESGMIILSSEVIVPTQEHVVTRYRL